MVASRGSNLRVAAAKIEACRAGERRVVLGRSATKDRSPRPGQSRVFVFQAAGFPSRLTWRRRIGGGGVLAQGPLGFCQNGMGVVSLCQRPLGVNRSTYRKVLCVNILRLKCLLWHNACCYSATESVDCQFEREVLALVLGKAGPRTRDSEGPTKSDGPLKTHRDIQRHFKPEEESCSGETNVF